MSTPATVAVDPGSDAIVLDEIVRNERLITHPTFGDVRLTRPTPRQERQIAEVRGRQYHKDLRDPDILSRAQLEKIAIERGMWEEEKTERVRWLSRRTGELMGLLDTLGYDSLETVTSRFTEVFQQALELFPENEEAAEVVRRYFDLEQTATAFDRRFLMNSATTSRVDELLEQGDLYRVQIDLLKELAESRRELQTLQLEQARLFMDSLESRSDRAEEIAQLYYCCTKPDGAPLWPNYEAAWDSRPEDIEVLIQQMFYFQNGITPEFQKILEKHGFSRRVADSDKPSGDSPDHPRPNSDGESLESEPESSSE